MIQGAMQDDTIAEGREHMILIAVWSPVLQPDRYAILLDADTCPHIHILAVFVLYITVQYLILFLIGDRGLDL